MDYERIKKNDDPKCEWRNIPVTELFKYIGKGKWKNAKEFKDSGKYPLISGTSNNNGIIGYVDKYDYNDQLYFTVPGCADIYNMFCQTEKFAATTNVHILQLNDKYEHLKENAEMICKQASEKFNDGTYSYHGNNLSRDRLLKESIKVPYNKETDEIDFSLTGRFDMSKMEVTRDVKVTDLFEIIGRGKTSTISTLKDGKYPLISCTGHNNGIVRFVDKYDYDGDYITIASNGDATAGYSFVQHGKFITTAGVLLLKPKDSKLIPILSELALAMTMKFRRKYSFNHALSVDRLKSEVIHQLPFKPDSKGNFKLDIDGIRYIYI